MLVTTSIEVFHNSNHMDLVRFLKYKGIHAPERIQDITQAFYLRLQEYDCLAKYNAALGTFEAYTIRILSNTMSDYFNDEPPAGQISELDGAREPSLVAERISDFRSWIIKHGGKQSDNLLSCLRARIRGDELNESMRCTYYRYLKEYLSA